MSLAAAAADVAILAQTDVGSPLERVVRLKETLMLHARLAKQPEGDDNASWHKADVLRWPCCTNNVPRAFEAKEESCNRWRCHRKIKPEYLTLPA